MSDKIMLQKDREQGNKFDSLYQDAQRRQERQEVIYDNCIEADCTFQPDTEKTKFYNYKMASISSSKMPGGRAAVFDRLSQGARMNSSYDRSKLCLDNSKHLTNDLFDPETGQEYFKPRVGRGPVGPKKWERDSADQKPGANLYREALKSRERKDSQRRQEAQHSKK
jgi:hypothetical protein